MKVSEGEAPLAVEAERLYDANDNEALFLLAKKNWPPSGQELPEGISEVCRYAFIRYTQTNQIDCHLWRARALTAAVMTGARDTAAGLLFQAFFQAIDIIVKKEQGGHEHGFQTARMILDEMPRLLPADAPRWIRLFDRLFHEKRGFALVMEATGGGRPSPAGLLLLDEAETDYQAALTVAVAGEDARGALKVRGGLALARYLRLADDPAEVIAESKRPLLEETRAIRSSAHEAGYRDVADWAAINADVMDRGEFVGWTPYEVV